MNDRKYDKYLVIFIDLLGSKDRIGFDEQYRVNTIFHDEFDKHKKTLDYVIYQRKIYTFSDCTYIFYGYKEGIEKERKDLGKLLTVALCNLETILLKLLVQKIVFRGGIVYGDAYVDPERALFFGEAVNNAYIMESKKARYPRILVDDFVATTIIENIKDEKMRMLACDPQSVINVLTGVMPHMPLTGEGIVEIDDDGNYIYNFLHLPKNNISVPEIYLDCEAFIESLIRFCEEQINKNEGKMKIVEKYMYLKDYCER